MTALAVSICSLPIPTQPDGFFQTALRLVGV